MSDDAWTVADPTLCPICGRESCEDHVPLSTDRPVRSRLIVRRALEEIAQRAPDAIVAGIAIADRLTVLVSESGLGKTFVLLDIAAAVAEGDAWWGRSVRGGSVVYVSYEGDALGLRLNALKQCTGRTLEHLYIVHATDPLSPRVARDGEEQSIGEVNLREALQTLAEDIRARGGPPITLIIIDTVRASMVGSEDSSEHVSAYLRAVRRVLAVVFGAAGLLAHHAGWQDGENHRKRERGSSAFRGNCDATLYLESSAYDATRGEASLTLRTLKIRDAERPEPLALVRRRVELDEQDAHGRPITSCVIVADERSPDVRNAEVKAARDAQYEAFDRQTLQALMKHPPVTSIKEAAHRLGIREDEVGASLHRLIDQNRVRKGSKKGPYEVIEALL